MVPNLISSLRSFEETSYSIFVFVRSREVYEFIIRFNFLFFIFQFHLVFLRKKKRNLEEKLGGDIDREARNRNAFNSLSFAVNSLIDSTRRDTLYISHIILINNN